MSDDNALIPRPGPQPRLITGPRRGEKSLYRQHVLDEDTYTDALSTIITRDFFPNLPHIHATNDYLSALRNNDPELLSSSIRKLAALAKAKEGGESTQEDARLRELENMGTPYMNVPGGRAPLRTPVGARGWDTPVDTRRRETDGMIEAGPSRPRKKRDVRQVRDDLSLDAFQANYTSEDNASFVQIVDEENRQRQEERWGWAWEAESKAEQRRIQGEEKRKMILDAATSGNWIVNAEGKRLTGGLAEGGKDRLVGEAWKETKLIEAESKGLSEPVGSSALVVSSLSALVKRSEVDITERVVPDDHPLRRALTEAGLPATALVSNDDGAVVPRREIASGQGDGRGRGENDRLRSGEVEQAVLGDEERDELSLGGSGVDQWGYKAMNSFMFPADAYIKPYPAGTSKVPEQSRSGPKVIRHANTSFTDQAEPSGGRAESSSGTSPSRSVVQAAVSGTPYRRRNEYPLLPQDASPSPSDLPSLLTWGTLLATPRALDDGLDPLDGPTFRLPESKRRDEIGRRLGDKASRSMNERAKGFTTPRPNHALKALAGRTRTGIKHSSGSMAPPSATPRRQDNLTPAAKRLLERSLGAGSRTPTARR